MYPSTLTSEIAEHFGCPIYSIHSVAARLGLKKDVDFLRKVSAEKMADPNHPGRKFHFKKGHTPGNKGKKQIEYLSPETIAKCRATCFQKGHRPKNHKPVGYERISVDGYIEVKVREPNVFKLKHRIVWEAHNGPIKRGENIQFRDGNSLNYNIENLYMITRNEQMKQNSGAVNLPDSMVAAYLSGSRSKRDYALLKELKKHPELLDLKRKQLLLNREIKKNHGK